jgi:peroxiredoxin
MKNVLLAVALLMCAVGNGYAQVENGKTAPDFTLTDSNGQSHQLSQYKGKYIVLEWFNPDCPFVVKHYGSGNMQALQKKYMEQGVVWLSINSSAPGKEGNYAPSALNEWAKKEKSNATALLIDSNGNVGKQYGAKTTPHMFIIDPTGNLIYQGAIDSINSPDPAVIPNSQNYVQSALDEAMAGKPVTTPATKSYGCSVKY